MGLSLILLTIGTLSRVESWSPSFERTTNSNKKKKHSSPPAIRDEQHTVTVASSARRHLFQHSASAAAAAIATSSWLFQPDASEAACIQGDLRPTCIGIYKIPYNEVYPFFDTPEQFEKLFPDLRYVSPIEKPPSYESAITVLKAQKAVASEEIVRQVLVGRLEEAGIRVLGVIPLVSLGCNRVLKDLTETKLRTAETMTAEVGTSSNNSEIAALAIEMLQNQAIDVNSYWNECDLVIGQGLRGELGSVTVAQVAILASLKEATRALDDFLAVSETLSNDEYFTKGNEWCY